MNPRPSSVPPPPGSIAEVRYSIVRLLEEIKSERATSTFAMERLDQHEIKKLFKAKAARAKRHK